MSPLKAPQTKTVSAAEVERLIATRETYQALKRRLDAMAEAVGELESSIITEIEAGVDFSTMGYSVRAERIGKRNGISLLGTLS